MKSILNTLLFCLFLNYSFAQQAKTAAAQQSYPFNDSSKSIEDRLANLLSLLTVQEKASFLSGLSMWKLNGVERLGIPSLQVTDCGHGVTVILDAKGNYTGCATSFPTGVAQAATWNSPLIHSVGAAIAKEAHVTGSSFVLGPMVNIHRVPVGGRNYESYSEDPFLTGKLAAAFINGVQSQRVGAVIKGFAANNQQKDQEHVMAFVSKKALQEIYFPAFRIAVEEANPLGLMTAYNGVNKERSSSSSYLIKDVIKKQWGFKGFVISDWRSVISDKAITEGLDIEMPGPPKFMGVKQLVSAIEKGVISENEIEEKAGRYLRAILKLGILDKHKPKQETTISNSLHLEIARKVSEESIVLLKNEGNLLPLHKNIRKVGVFGPNATVARLGGGGSASVSACTSVSPLTGLKNVMPADIQISYLEGASQGTNFPVIPVEQLTNGEGGKGLKAEFFSGYDLKGPVKCSRTDDKIDFSWGWASPCDNVSKTNYSVRWTGNISAPVTGNYQLGISVIYAGARLYLDGKLIIDEWGNPGTEITEAKFVSKAKYVEVFMEKGSSHEIKLEFHRKLHNNSIRLEWKRPDLKDPITEAVELAQQSDVAIVYAGLSNLFEGGNNDKKDLKLPGDQNKLISAIAAANPNTIVVLINGTPLEMPWINEVKSVVEAFYPGQEGGDAIANVLTGAVNPSGKLPDSYPVALTDVKAMQFYPGKNMEVHYNEELHVGYRQFEADGIKPLFAFGHGLSYTQFKFQQLKIKKIAGDKVKVILKISNVGKVSGAEVIQVYIRDRNPEAGKDFKELKGFLKVNLASGKSKKVSIDLDKYAFSYYDAKEDKWKMSPGLFDIEVGSSSDNILLKKSFKF